MVDVAGGRGRPKGSGKDDSGPLMMVARLMVDDPKLTATTAMKRVLRASDRHRWPGTDETLIRRWQVKWKAEGASYLQKVRDEQAATEAERRRREQAAQTRRADHRTAWGLMADARAAGHAPGWALQTAMQELAARNVTMNRTVGDLLASANTMPKMGLSAGGAIADLGSTRAAMRGIMGVTNLSGIGEAMRKYDTMGRAMAQIGSIPHMPKLPKIP